MRQSNTPSEPINSIFLKAAPRPGEELCELLLNPRTTASQGSRPAPLNEVQDLIPEGGHLVIWVSVKATIHVPRPVVPSRARGHMLARLRDGGGKLVKIGSAVGSTEKEAQVGMLLR